MDREEFLKTFCEVTNMQENRFHPLVWISGDPEIGNDVYIGGMSEVYAKGAKVSIGNGCDIASFVVINCSGSHRKVLGIDDNIDKQDIIIENNVYIGTQSFVGGGTHIGHHSVIGAGTIVPKGEFPPYTLIVGNPAVVKPEYYKNKCLGVDEGE